MTSHDHDVVERNKATFRRLQEEVIVKGRVELVEEIFAPDFTTLRAGTADLMISQNRPPYPQSGTAHERFISGRQRMTEALSDQERTIEAIGGEGDTVWARWRISAVHSGEYLGVPPTGKRLEYTEVGFLRFDADGRIAEGWFLCDEVNIARQLGLALVP
ncbi:ester cyclase [Streptomyces sp. NPDC055105]|uniref:ester cyclase n=1 Tax=Streptomyces sp. NPDC055105 TaxID=3365719 RepID=UPI0037CDDB06